MEHQAQNTNILKKIGDTSILIPIWTNIIDVILGVRVVTPLEGQVPLMEIIKMFPWTCVINRRKTTEYDINN